MLAKIKKWFIEFILITLAISGCTRSAPVNVSSLDTGEKAGKGFSLLPEGLIKKKVTVTPPGDYVQTLTVKEEILEGAKTRSYGLHVPVLYDGKTAVPLVIMLHGTGMSSADFAQMTRFNAISDSNGFIVIYPDAFGEQPMWNPGFFESSGANDVVFISTLIDHMLQEFNIDPKTVFVGGYFDGGMMAYKLAAVLPEKISAVGAVGSTVAFQKAANEVVTLEPALAPVSVFAIQGFLDETVPADMTKSLKKGTPGFMPGSSALHYWLQNDGCDPTAAIKKTKNENVIKRTFTCKNGTAVRWISIWDGNHDWPGTTDKKASKTINASEAMWEFFVAHPRQ
jgi:polyhydroxybutyrate depolymerase